MAGGRSSVLTIDEILNDKKLFLQYVLGDPCLYCNAFKIEKIKDDTIEDIKENANKQTDVRNQRLALLKAKMKKINENPQIDLVEEAEKKASLKCDDTKCFDPEYLDLDKLNSKYDSIIKELKKNIEVWEKKGYNIFGCKEEDYGLKFVRDNQEIKYFNKSEKFEKNCSLGALEVFLFSDWIKLVNDDLRKFVKEFYK